MRVAGRVQGRGPACRWGGRLHRGCETPSEFAAGQVTAEAAACSKTRGCEQRVPDYCWRTGVGGAVAEIGAGEGGGDWVSKGLEGPLALVGNREPLQV